MQISHAEAQNLIQYNLDRALDSEKQRILLVHLQECDACRGYADEMLNIENTLRQVMNKQWHQRPLPLSVEAIKSQKSSHQLFQLRTALVSLLLVAFSFFIWQMTTTAPASSGQIPSAILLVPTPSTQFVTASIASPGCEWSLYKVEESDTLESITIQHSVPKEEIMSFNNMNSELVYESMELKIPQCTVTPTMTAHLPTTTLTPILEWTIDTPG